ncbi:SulP family inorganic anion transporter [Nonomuraea sp. KM88]|uniref:SulP family inorganic anion transporter n=1 Tax=Nonomuraea sp. KM88 TaxID=3457427 RepID=UPI003FCDD5CE
MTWFAAGMRGPLNWPKEITAGVTLAALAIPLNIGYAQIAGLPPIVGLYAAIVPMLVFALVCSSRQLVASPDAPIAALIASLLVAIAAKPGSPQYVELAYAQALVCAAVFLLFYAFKLGFLASFLSEPVLVGFIAGLAVEILISQVEKILGIHVTAERFFPELWEIITKIPQAHLWSVVVGVATMLVIVALRRFLPALPGPLVALVAATVAVAWAGLDSRGVSVLGHVPSGLPVPHWPQITLGQWAALIPGAIAICAVTLADGLLTARRYAEQHHYRIDANTELRAFGLANAAAGFTQSMTIGSSASRTAAMDATGSRSQIPSVVCAIVVAVLVAFFSGLLAYLPNTALAGIVAVAVVRLIDARKLAELWRLRRSEFWIAVVCLLGVPVLGSLSAVIIAFLLSAVDVVRRASRPGTATLRPGEHGRYVRGQEAGPLTVYRFESQLFFANTDTFKTEITHLADQGARWIVLDAEAITDVDTTGAQALRETADMLRERGVTFAVSRATGSLRRLLARYGLAGLTYYDSNEAAAAAYRESDHG